MTTTYNDQWRETHLKRKAKLLIADPWQDKLARKAGLVSNYICDAITELADITAEKDVASKLSCQNPMFTTCVDLINDYLKATFLKEPDQALKYKALECFIVAHIGRPLTVPPPNWGSVTEFSADIRVLDTIDEAMYWLSLWLSLT